MENAGRAPPQAPREDERGTLEERHFNQHGWRRNPADQLNLRAAFRAPEEEEEDTRQTKTGRGRAVRRPARFRDQTTKQRFFYSSNASRKNKSKQQLKLNQKYEVQEADVTRYCEEVAQETTEIG